MQPSSLEKAILEWFAERCDDRSVVDRLGAARVASRDHTGVGMFVHLGLPGTRSPAASAPLDSRPVAGPDIVSAALPHGAGTVVFLTDGVPDVLEIFSYGHEHFPEELREFELCEPPAPS